MTNSGTAYQEMLADLERDLAPVERQRNDLITAINIIRKKAGLQPRPGGGSGGGISQPIEGEAEGRSGGVLTTIRSDTFVGKRLRSAAKEYLAMRRAQGLDGPATPREIYDAIMSGGFEFEAKDENTRLISLRNTLRKRSEVFRKFENTGKYGLQEWYGGIVKRTKPAGIDDDDDADDEDKEPATTKKAAAGS